MANEALIRSKREAAQRARRLSKSVASAVDRARMLTVAHELDEEADALEGLGRKPCLLDRGGHGQGPQRSPINDNDRQK